MIGKLALCGLFALALAAPYAPSARKCVPKQFEFVTLGKVAQVAGGQPMVYSFVGTSSLDYITKREAIHQMVNINGTSTHHSMIVEKMKAYIIISDTKSCTVVALSEPMIEVCDDTGTLLQSYELGGKMVDMYEFDQKIPGTTIRQALSVFRDTFTPVSSVAEQMYSGISQMMMATQTGNVTMGIKDQKVFEIPSYCNSD